MFLKNKNIQINIKNMLIIINKRIKKYIFKYKKF